MDAKRESESPPKVKLFQQLPVSSPESQVQPSPSVVESPPATLQQPAPQTPSQDAGQDSKIAAGRLLAHEVLGPELIKAPSLAFLLPQAWKLSRDKWELLRAFLEKESRAREDAQYLKQFVKEREEVFGAAPEGSCNLGTLPQPDELIPGGRKLSAALGYQQAQSASHAFTLVVGLSAETFDIPGRLLANAPLCFKSNFFNTKASPGDTADRTHIHLISETVEAVALVVDWLHGKGLPYYDPCLFMDGDTTTGWLYLLGHQKITMAWLPSVFNPRDPSVTVTVLTKQPNQSAGSPPEYDLFRNVCCMDSYAGLSTEELRFIETTPGQGQRGTYLDWLQQILPQTGHPCMFPNRQYSPARPSLHNKDEIVKLLHAERVIDRKRVCLNVRGEYLQYLLIKVLSLAERYQWERLFNEAMDAYREGERNMKRETPLAKHVEMAFAFLPQSPMRQFMADYAFYTSRHGHDHHAWVRSGLQQEDFLQAVIERHEGRVQVAGYDPTSQYWDETRSPMAENGPRYHIHEGQHWCFNRWSLAGRLCAGQCSTDRATILSYRPRYEVQPEDVFRNQRHSGGHRSVFSSWLST